MGKKATIQVDFVIAVGIFIIVLGFTVNFMTNYLTTIKDTARMVELRADAFSLLEIADRGFAPENWTDYPDRIGLATRAYKFTILVNNTKENLVNQNNNVSDLSNELISFNYSSLGFAGVDYNSTAIYYNGNPVAYNISGDVVTFSTAIEANLTKEFIIYFDDDSAFNDSSTVVSGSNNLTETTYPVEEVTLLQYKKISKLNNSDYSNVKSSIGMKNDFRIKIYDIELNQTFLSYGGSLPRKGDIVSLQRYVLYQNSTGGIRKGRMTIQVW